MPTSPHDRLVKKTFEQPENAAGELRAVLPTALVAAIDWSTLRLEPGSFVDEEARQRHTDLLFSAEVVGERRAYVYVLFEHQSTPDRWMPLRVLGYVVRIWSRLCDAGTERLPVVVPVVLHHGEDGWNVARRLGDVVDVDDALEPALRRFVPDFELLVDDLVRVPEAELAARAMTALARLTLWALRAIRVGFDRQLLSKWVADLDEALRTAGREALEVFFVYLSEVQQGDAIYAALLNEGASEGVREVTVGLRKKWEDQARAEGREAGREEGIEQGLEQGLEQGREEGLERGRREALTSMLLAQLQLKFGSLPGDVEARLRQASLDELTRWGTRVLTAATLDEVLGP
jgi:predicted transposase/invertase (TIGR01784 family)